MTESFGIRVTRRDRDTHLRHHGLSSTGIVARCIIVTYAIIQTIPAALLGGASIVVFGLIAVAGVKIWIDSHIDFSKNSNLIIAAVTVIMGTGNFSLHLGGFDLGGIGTATLAAIILNALFNYGSEAKDTNKSLAK